MGLEPTTSALPKQRSACRTSRPRTMEVPTGLEPAHSRLRGAGAATRTPEPHLARPTGFEPAISTVTGLRGRPDSPTSAYLSGGRGGIRTHESLRYERRALAAWLPCYNVYLVGKPENERCASLNPPALKRMIGSGPDRFAFALPHIPRGWVKTRLHGVNLVARDGLEPPTSGLWAQRAGRCSTAQIAF